MSVASFHGERLSDEFVTENAEYAKKAPSALVTRTRHTLPASGAAGAPSAIVTEVTTLAPSPAGAAGVVATVVRVPLLVRQSSSTSRPALKPLPAIVIDSPDAFAGSDAGVTATMVGGSSAVTVRPSGST